MPSLKNTALIFLELFLIECWGCFSGTTYDVITFLICIIQKGKRHSSLRLKAFQISTNYLSLHRHLKQCHVVFVFKFASFAGYCVCKKRSVFPTCVPFLQTLIFENEEQPSEKNFRAMVLG